MNGPVYLENKQFIGETLFMRKSVKREYELDRSYDYADSLGFKNTKQNVGFVKRRSHKRLRHQLKNNKEGLDIYGDIKKI